MIYIKDKMSKEKRKFIRSECLLPAEVIQLQGKSNLIERATAHDFSQEGLKLTVYLNLKKGSNIELKLYLPEKKLTTFLSGEITWAKSVGNKLEIGLKIKEMDDKSKKEILDWIFPGWIEKEK